MTKVDARKILGISRSAGVKSAERAYRQKSQNLQARMLPGNPCSDRRKALAELAELTEARKAMQTKRSTKKSHAKPRATVNHRRSARQTFVLDVIHDMVENWNVFIKMIPLRKPVALTILIVEFALVITTLVLHLIRKGA